MAIKKLRDPKYRLHKPSGLGVVTLSGKDHYLGKYGSKASLAEYDRLVGEWRANGRRLPDPASEAPGAGPTMGEVILAYWKFAETYYLKGGKPTSSLDLIRRTMKVVRELYGHEPAAEFGPLALKAVRDRFVERGLSRNTCNANVARIKRMIRWASEQELIPPATYHALLAVRTLPKGRTTAPDHPPVRPAPPEHVAAVLPLVRPQIAAMIRIQDLTGMRPHDVCVMRACDIDKSDPACWRYHPEGHKTEHLGKERVVLIGPRGQEVLAPWLERYPEGYLFRPRPLPEKPQSWRTRKGRWAPGPRYSARSYGAIIRRACDRAKVPRWAPNQLRHSVGTRIRQAYGLEAAQTVLGHARADVTQLYAERDANKARAVIAEIG